MPPIERDAPRDGDLALKHSHSASSDHSRALVPMWDSSDPDRAPPPLPLNPQSPSLASRAGTSSAIQSAHAALTERARESALVSSALAKRMSEVSPERPNVKSAPAHRRMQSLQTGTVRDLSLMIEGGQTSFSPRSPEKLSRPSTPSKHYRSESRSDPFTDAKQEDRNEKAFTMAPGPSLTPIVRPTARRAHQSILGENTPPQSATMLALQNMPTTSKREAEPAPLSEVTNGSTALVKVPQSLDHLSNQILTLTNIATSLQKEMSQLSRRSRDNATDLLSLKEATNQRDEDIRKNLRDLLHNVHEAQAKYATRDPYGASLLLDNKPHTLSPTSKAARPFSLPRIPSPNSFAASIDRESMSTPSLYGGDPPAIIALLEKIVREMSTREGQELLITRLSDVADKLAGMATAGKVEDLLQYVKSRQDHSLVPASGGGGAGNRTGRSRNLSFSDDPRFELDFGGGPGPMTQRVERLIHDKDTRRSSAPSTQAAADVISDDVLKIIRTIKDSVAQGGGLTAEVKALVRELRGEVLGMGREIGRRLEEATMKDERKPDSATKADMMKIIEEGLDEMKQHMNHLLREHRRQSAASVASRASAIDYTEIYNAMRTALKDSKEAQPPDLHREDVIEAVRDAWENYKPEIQVEQLGLDRDEVLACLKEGLQQYAPQDERPMGATREEVFKAVVEGLKHFVPPQVDTPASLSRDEILEAVRECLEEFEFPVAPSAIGADLSRQDMVEAVKEGLSAMDFSSKTESPLVLHDAAPNNDEIVLRLHEIMEYMRAEFKAVSDEAKQNVAANGRDTEQVLDATKDGLEKLRTDIENYVDRAAGVTGQEEVMECLVKSLDGLKEEITELVSHQSEGSKEMLRAEIESLRDTVNTSLVPATTPAVGSNEEILHVLQDGLSSLRTEISSRPLAGTNEVLDALQEGLNDIRLTIDKMGNKPSDLTANDEILDALKLGLDSVRSDIDGLREESKSDRAVAPVNDNAIIPAEVAKHDDIKNLEVLITQLRIKLEAMEDMPHAAQAPPPATDAASKEDLSTMEEMLRNLQESVAGMSNREAPLSTDPATREDVQAIETILRNTKARLDDVIDGEQAVRKEHIDLLETLVLETQESLSQLTSQMDGVSRREDVTTVESLITQVVGAFDEMKERHEKQLEDPERVTKTDMEAIEEVCLDVKSVIEQMVKADLASLSSKDDLQNLESLVKEVKELTAKHLESSSRAVELHDAENTTVGDRVTEVKSFLEGFQDMMKSKLQEGASGIDSLTKLLETLSETVNENVDMRQDLKEMFETMKTEFEESKAGVVGAKLDTDEKFQETTDTLGTKIDERVNELVTRYDEFQVAMDERAKAGEARDLEMEAAVVGTKAVADDLKVLVDTLGSAVTDSLEKMEEASKTVFGRVEDMLAKSEENHSDDKAEHQLTRDHVKQAIGVAEGIQGHVVEYQPKILDTLKDVLDIVGQHYEHSKSSTTELQQRIEEAKPPEQPLLPAVEKYDDTSVQEKLDKLMEKDYDDSKVHEKLDKLVEREYDDSQVQEKLDKLVDHTQVAGQAFAQLETLDQVHQQVLKTAAEISEFISAQTQRIADDHEDKEKTLQETIVALERRLAQKEQVEASVLSLKEEEDRLKQSVLTLRVEQESLVRQKMRLTGDVSSLETALHLRREELQDMEARAEGLERRILEGVMDHSRILLMAKSNKGRDAMSRKRVPSQKPPADGKQGGGDSKPRSALNMALNSTRGGSQQSPAGTPRRILSLSQITGNVPAGGFKRSQSVRHPGAASGGLRKSSWGGRLPSKGYGDLSNDKENMELRESEEEHDEAGGDHEDAAEHHEIVLADPSLADPSEAGDVSDTETLRRSSRGTTVFTGTTGSYLGTEGEYSDRDYADSEWTESVVGTESTIAPSSLGPTSSLGGEEGNEVVLYQG
ncbi:hypothetical protein NKR23_g4467 [Pleurostoma richardsiae]|uniref:Uncharacterized protein n=1 Tax=Pleurostoma richardsiae TaxID=41990 RepID=A0AA38RJ53_9PEZI|nr:hypothetical protein NKR23_g4467 [Pleurostoma richardsiae]